jgi:uncharacterized protein YjbI with pentapeptide repeats
MKITKNLAKTLKSALGENSREKVRRLDFDGASFDRARFDGASFDRASFDRASFDGASFDRASFDGASFDGASFDRARFDGASFDGASFDGASFDRARFDGARFDGASFDRASFDGASFDRARFDRARFDGASFDDYKKIHLVMLANACVYPLNVTFANILAAKEKTEAWKLDKTPITRKGDGYEACESGWKMAFGSEDYVITDDATHAFWFFCWRAG